MGLENNHRLALLQAVFDEIPDVILLKDAQGNFLLGNAALAKLYDVAPDDLVGKSDADFGVSPGMAEEFRQNVMQIMARGVTEVVFERSRDAITGEIRHFKSIKKPFSDAVGNKQILVIANDVTDIVRAQEQVAVQEQRLRDVMAATCDGIWDWHIASGHLIHNDQWYQLIGYSAGEIPDHVDAFAECIHPDDKARVWQALQSLLHGETSTYHSEHRMLCKDGSTIWVLDRGKIAERDADGHPLRVVGAFSDITANKLANQALEDALLAANQATRAKSEFLATMSHEIRTPMNGILGMAQLLMSESVSEPERQEWAKTILDSGQTLLTLLNDILDLSKVEAGKFELQPSPILPCRIVEESVAIFEKLLLSKHLLIEIDCPLEGRLMSGDGIRLRQMLSNYLSNAIKFTQQGKIRVQVREVAVQNGNVTLEFSVTDSGIGIPPEKQHLLFNPFTQVDGSSTRRFGGTGLGLSIVRRLAELMQGSVGVESAEGTGSRFWFRVQLKILADQAPGAKAETHANMTGSQQFSGRILVVEDNPVNRKVILGLLRKLGLSAEIAENGAQALDRLANEQMDLVLMDIQMPVMDGLTATAKIRAAEQAENRRRCPIVALTAGAFDEDKQQCIDVGMDGFIAKPVAFSELTKVLQKWLTVQSEINPPT